MKNIKYFFGPMTKNVIDSVIEYSNETKIPFGFIPSRRQVEWNGGYTGFTTHDFLNYVQRNSKYIIIERDHGGIGQGKEFDNGMLSIYKDTIENIDLIHIDPWKVYTNYNHGLRETLDIINFVLYINSNIEFEVGTEESIKPFSPHLLQKLLYDLQKNLGNNFSKIKYAVIQSGTSLRGIKNTGKFDLNQLKEMVSICKEFNILSKEHNGDYLTKEEIQLKFDNGLDAINIAPELGVFETKILLNHISNKNLEMIFIICLNGLKWKKWVNEDFSPYSNKRELIEISGHYHNKEIKSIVNMNDELIKNAIKNKLKNYETFNFIS